MKISPTSGLAFILEDKEENETKSGIIKSTRDKFVTSQGTILAVNAVSICPDCQKSVARSDIKEGDRVLYSKFVAEHIEVKEIEKEHGGRRLYSVPVDSILAIIS